MQTEEYKMGIQTALVRLDPHVWKIIIKQLFRNHLLSFQMSLVLPKCKNIQWNVDIWTPPIIDNLQKGIKLNSKHCFK